MKNISWHLTKHTAFRTLLLLAIIILISCGENKTAANFSELQQVVIDTSISVQKDTLNENAPADTTDYDHATYYVVVADTSMDYFILHTQMNELHQKLKMPIDTMGRYFNKKKNLIALPDNDEDEMYAGDYYPRRFPTENLSLEYLALYGQGGEKTIALVAGIYEPESRADSALSVLKANSRKAFKIKTNMFIGCLH